MPYEVHCAEHDQLNGSYRLFLCWLISKSMYLAFRNSMKSANRIQVCNLWKLFCHLCVVCKRWSMNSLWVCHLRVRLHNTFLNWVCSLILSRPLNILLMWKNRKAEQNYTQIPLITLWRQPRSPPVIQDSAQESVHHQRLDKAWISC